LGINIDYDLQGRPIRRQLQDAYTKEPILIITVIEGEADTGLVTIKDMRDRSEKKLKVNELGEVVTNLVVARK
jgi:histidyl-tRNA synthetase